MPTIHGELGLITVLGDAFKLVKSIDIGWQITNLRKSKQIEQI